MFRELDLKDLRTGLRGNGLRRRALCIGLLVLLTGCRERDRIRNSRTYDRITHGGRFDTRPVPGKMAAAGRDAIISECAHETYANASKGLIVGEAGLHEDVFALRDRASLAATGYELDEALRLEEMLDAEAKAAGRSEDQANCIAEFAEHLGGLTDTLVQADKAQKEMDVSAFNEANKQANEQARQLAQKLLDQATPATPH
jgi:hypothetical protein